MVAWRASIIGLVIAVFLLGVAGWVSLRRLDALQDATELVQHTLLVRAQAVEVLSLLKDGETGMRGFVITGRPSYLEPYETAVAALPSSLANLRRLTADNPTQQANIASLERLIDEHAVELREDATVRQRDGFEAAVQQVESAQGKRLMDAAREAVAAIEAEEDRLFVGRQADQARDARLATATSLGSIGAALVLLAAATLLMSRAVAQRDRERTARATAEAIAAAVRESEERLRVTIASIGDAVIATDEHGRVTQLNPIAESLTGWTAGEAVGRPLDDVFVIVNERSRQPAENPVHSVLRDGGIAGLANHTSLISRDGRETPIDDSAAPIRGADGRPIGVVMVFRDITERRRLERERASLMQAERAARHEAEQANHHKDRFLAMVSHELRTPLNAILGWADMLQMGLLPENQRERALMAIHTNVKREEQIVADLLDISAIISGKLQLTRAKVSLPEIIGAAIDVVGSSADAKQIQIATDIDHSVGPTYADSARLQQVLSNLLSNAVKFTPQGGAIHVRLGRAGSGIELSVSDTGRGIPAEFLPSVFEPFWQEDRSAAGKRGGLGLGLAIVRQLVEAHGWTVRVESPGQGQGSTFTIELPPVAIDEESPTATHPQPSNTEPRPNTLHGLSVLVVDDNSDGRELTAATLESAGADVHAAGSVAEALSILDRQPVDVLISDIVMPQGDGYDLIERIRAGERSGARALAAGALTSSARDEDRDQALRAGYQLYLTKPVAPRALIEAVANLAHSRLGHLRT